MPENAIDLLYNNYATEQKTLHPLGGWCASRCEYESVIRHLIKTKVLPVIISEIITEEFQKVLKLNE